jgi:hypothetical protein
MSDLNTLESYTAATNLQTGCAHGVHYIKDFRIKQLDNIVWSIYPGDHNKGVAAANAELERRIRAE